MASEVLRDVSNGVMRMTILRGCYCSIDIPNVYARMAACRSDDGTVVVAMITLSAS